MASTYHVEINLGGTEVELGVLAVLLMVICLGVGILGHCLGCSDKSAPTQHKCWPLCSMPEVEDDGNKAEKGFERVVVPQGVQKGDILQVNLSKGRNGTIRVPVGANSGDVLEVAVPDLEDHEGMVLRIKDDVKLREYAGSLWNKLADPETGTVERLACWDTLLADGELAELVGESDAARGRKILKAMKSQKALDVSGDGKITSSEFHRLCDPRVLVAAEASLGPPRDPSRGGTRNPLDERIEFLTSQAKFSRKRAETIVPRLGDLGLNTRADFASDEAPKKLNLIKEFLDRSELRRLKEAMETESLAIAHASMPWNNAAEA